jgi:hypothetical protein
MIPLCIHEQSCYVDTSRNRIVKQFLELPAGEATHLMMIDVDLSFSADAFNKTYQIMEALNLDVLFGNYVLGNSGNSIFGAPENVSKEAAVLVKLKPNVTYTDVWTGGTGWLMMRRTLLERMKAECEGPWYWFPRDLTADGTDRRGEDISFGLRLYNMNPKPKVAGTTAVLLRHMKLQPFIPDFMGPLASAEQVAALAFPNPYENDPKFIINGNNVIEVSKLTPEQLAALKKEIEDAAVGRSDGQVQEGGPAQREQAGSEGAQPQASHSDHAE